MQRGFTLIELLLVMVLVSILAIFVFSSLIDYRDRQTSRATILEVSSLIKETRHKTLSAETDSQFGIHIANDGVVVFEGGVYDAGDAANRNFFFANTNFLTQFSDGSDEIVFSRLTGIPSATGTIDIGDLRSNSTTTLTITSSGLIE